MNRVQELCGAHNIKLCPSNWARHAPSHVPLRSLQACSSSSASPRAYSRRHMTRAVAEATREVSQTVQPVQQGSWHAVVANAKFMLHDVQNEAFAEQLRERRRLYTEKKQPLDFWLVSEPAWLDELFPEQAKKVRRPCVALVSTDRIWMDFMKLRLDRVLRLELGEQLLKDVLSSRGPVPKFEPLDKGKWTAPYPPYRPGWWEVFMQDSSSQHQA